MNITIEVLKTLRDELDAKFGPTEVIAYPRVSQSQLSIARHYGGITLNSHNFTYNPTDDSLIRDDVLKWASKLLKEREKNQPKPEPQPELF